MGMAEDRWRLVLMNHFRQRSPGYDRRPVRRCSRDPPFRIKFDRPKRDGRFPERADANRAHWFVGAAVEQLALIADDGFHVCLSLMVN